MQTSNLPARIPVPFASAGAKNTIPVPSQIAITPGAASFTDGFPPATRTPIAAGGVPPYGMDFNGILNAITVQNQWENAGGQYPFDAPFAASIGGYPKGALLARVGYEGFWLCTADNNSTNPDTGGAGWQAIGVVGFDYGLDTGTANTYTVEYSPAVLTVADGMVVRFKAKTANTGASTFSPNGLTAKPVIGLGHAALQGGEIIANGDVWLQWNSSIGSGSWILIASSRGVTQTSSSETVAGIAKLATQLLTTAGVDNTTMVTPKKLRAGFQFVVNGLNGYIIFPQFLGGFIIQWGTTTQAPANGSVTANYLYAFPTAVLKSLAFYDAGDSPNVATFNVSRINNSSLKINNTSTNAATPSFISIGY